MMKKYLALLLCLVLAVCPVTGAFASISLPASLQVIESEAFAGDMSVSGVVTLPGSVTSIGSSAFANTNLFALRTSSNVRNIGSNVLAGTDAVYALVPSRLASLEADALSGAANIITNSGSPVYYWAKNNGKPVYTNTDVNLHDGFYYAYNDEMTEVTLLFAASDSISGEVTVPAFVDGRKVTAIGEYGFTRLSGVTAINVPEGVSVSDDPVNWPSAEIRTYPVYTDEPILPDDETAVDLGLNYSEVTMNPGEVITFSLNEYVSSATNSWSVDFTDESLLKPHGVVYGNEISFEALELGATTLTLSRTDEAGVIHYGVCRIHVVEPEVVLNVSYTDMVIHVGEMIGINFNYTTSGMSDEVNFSCTSSDESVVAVFNPSGGIEGVSAGEADVTFGIEQYGATSSVTVHVTVVESELHFEQNDILGYTGYTYQAVLTDEIPEDAKVEWTSILPELASVDENGLISCHSTGDSHSAEVMIKCTVTYADGTVKTGYLVMSMIQIDMSWRGPDSYSIMSGEKGHELDVGVNQWYWNDDYGKWSYSATSSDDSILSFVNAPNEKWRVDTHKPGDVVVTLTITFLDHTRTFELPIHVETPYMYAFADPDSIDLIVGEQGNIGYWYDAEIPVLESFSSSDPSIVTIDARGQLYAKGPGNATVFYTISGGGVSASDSVNVNVYGVNASFPQDEYTIEVGEVFSLVPQFELPEGVSVNYEDYTFESLDYNIASVNQTGRVVGISAGTVTITFGVNLKGVENCDWAHAYASAVVHVVDPDAMITLSESSLAFVPGETKTVTATFAKEPESVSWWTSNSEAYSVDNGVITANRYSTYPAYDLIICSAVIDGVTYEARLQVSTKQAVASMDHGPEWIGVGSSDVEWMYFNWATSDESLELHLECESMDDTIATVSMYNVHEVMVTGVSKGVTTVKTSLYDAQGNLYGVWPTEVRVDSPVEPAPIAFEYETYAVCPEGGNDNWRWVNLVGDTVNYYDYSYTVGDQDVLNPGWCEFWGKTEGMTTYTATSNSDPQYSATATVYVQEWDVTADKTQVGIGDTVTISLKNYPTAVPYAWMNWAFDEWMFSEVSRDEYSITLRARCSGTAVVNADVYMGERGYWKNENIEITVSSDPDYRMNYSDITACPGDIFDFRPEYGDINWGQLSWESSDVSVASVDANGIVTAKSIGQCEITCHITFNDGRTVDAVCYVSVEAPEWTLVAAGMPETVFVGSYYGFWPDFITNGFFTPEYTVTVSDESILEHELPSEQNGWMHHVRAVAPGAVTITVTATDGEKTETVRQTLLVIDADLRFAREHFTLYTNRTSDVFANSLIVGNGKSLENSTIEFKSYDESMLTFEDGVAVTHDKTGRLIVAATVTFADGTTATATAEVHIEELGEIYLNVNPEGIAHTELFTLQGYERPHTETRWIDIETNAPDEMITIEWSTADETIATAVPNYAEDALGRCVVLTGLQEGTTQVIVKITAGDKTQTCYGNILVEEPYVSAEIYAENVTISLDSDWWLDVNTDTNLSNTTRVYSSSDTGVAIVEASGRVRPLTPGTAIITVTHSCGDLIATDSVAVTVTGIETYMLPESAYLNVGEMITVVPEYLNGLPEGVRVYSSSFHSSNEDVATVDGLGNVYAKSAGWAVITYRSDTSAGSVSCRAYIEVEDPNAKLSLDHVYLLLTPGNTYQFSVITDMGEPDSFRWSSTDEYCFPVDETGLVTSNPDNDSNSNAVITYTAVYGDAEYSATCYVASTERVASLFPLETHTGLQIGNERDQYINWNTTEGYENLDWGFEVIGDEGVITAERTNDHNIHIKAIGSGKATLVVRLYDNSPDGDYFTYHTRYASYWVGVDVEPSPIAYEYESYAVHTEASGQWNHCNMTIVPGDVPHYFYITSTSSDETIFSGDNFHSGYGKNQGVATYTATIQDYPQYTATTTVYVQDWHLAADKTDVKVGDIVTFSIENYPTAVPYEYLNWYYDNWRLEEVARDEYSISLRVKANGEFDVRADLSMGERGYWQEEVLYMNATADHDIHFDSLNYVLIPDEAVSVRIDGDISDFTLTCSDETIATVNGNQIIAFKTGECDVTIDISFNDGTTEQYTCHVTVVEPSLNVKYFRYDEMVAVGAAAHPDIDWEFAGWHEPEVTVKSSDETIAKVDGWAVIGVNPGTVTVTVEISKGTLTQTVEQEITVVSRPVRFSSENDEYHVYEGCTLPLKLIPEEGRTIESVVWQSLDPSVATVDENGVVTGVSAGSRCLVTAYVQFSDNERASASCWVRVESLDGLNLNHDIENDRHELSTKWFGGQPQSSYTYIHFHNEIPDSMLSIEWTIDHPEIASIETNPDDLRAVTVTAESAGETILRASVKLVSGETVLQEANIEIPVTVRSASFSINPPETAVSLSMDETHCLEWGIQQENVYWPVEYQYISSNEDVVLPTIHEHVETVNPGTATVTRIVKVHGQEIGRASIDVTVWGPIITNTESLTLDVGTTGVVTGSAAGVSDADREIVIYNQYWTSSDDNVAIVSPEGDVYGVHPGKATLILHAETNYGHFQGYCDVTVTGAADVTLNETHLELYPFDTFQLVLSSAIGTPESVVWTVDGDVDAIHVDETGLVTIYDCDRMKTAAVVATATINGKEYTASCEVDVLIQTIFGTRLYFDTAGWANMDIGESRDVTEGLWIAGDETISVEYRSDDPSVAYVDDANVLHAVSRGETYVYMVVTSSNGEVNTRNMLVTVGMPEPALESVTTAFTSYAVGAEGLQDWHEVWIDYQTTPFNMNSDLVFTSSNEGVAIADHSCIHGINPGTTTVTITSKKNPAIHIPIEIAVFGNLEIKPQMSGTFLTGSTIPLHIEGQTWDDELVSSIQWYLHNVDSSSSVESWVDEDMRLHVGNDAGNLRIHAHVNFRDGHFVDVFGLVAVDNTNTAQYAPYYCHRSTNVLYANVGDAIDTWVHTFDNVGVASATYKSANPDIASVSGIADSVNSIITCHALGSTYVTATITREDGVTVDATLGVNVIEVEQPDFYLGIDTKVIKVGGTSRFHLAEENTNSRRPTSEVTFSDPSIAEATYDKGTDTWLITGLKAGAVEMTVSGTYGNLTTTKTYTICVVD